MRLLPFLYLTICLLTSLRIQASELTKVDYYGTNPGNLDMYTYIPANIDTTTAHPMVVVLHGCSQTANAAAELSGWNKLADLYGFYIVYPQTKVSNNMSACYNWFNEGDISKGQGECASIHNMQQYMYGHYKIDSSKVFITGLSAGAAMGVVMMATYPNEYNAGAIFAGGAYKLSTNIATATAAMAGWVIKSPKTWGDLVRTQNPTYKGPYPKLILYQGTEDAIVNKRNAGELIKQWADIWGMEPIPVKAINSYEGIKDITRSLYKTKQGITAITYYEVGHMGHALLVKPGQCRNEGGRDATFSVNKGFHSTYQTALDFGLIPSPNITGKDVVHKNETALTFSVPAYTGSSYTWQLPAGCTITSASSGPNIVVNWGAESGDILVSETDSNGCVYNIAALYVTAE